MCYCNIEIANCLDFTGLSHGKSLRSGSIAERGKLAREGVPAQVVHMETFDILLKHTM